jgi:hypothetical protein
MEPARLIHEGPTAAAHLLVISLTPEHPIAKAFLDATRETLSTMAMMRLDLRESR